MRIAVIGSEGVGLVSAACFAELGHHVICVDDDENRVAALNNGKVLIHEDYLAELLARHVGSNLTFSSSLTAAVRECIVIVMALETPMSPAGEADLSYIESVIQLIARTAKKYKVIVEKSTVPVYTNAWIQRTMVLNGARIDHFDTVSNPEFLREGNAVTDFLYPDRIVVGVNTERAAQILREVYRPLLDGSYAAQLNAVSRPDEAKLPPRYIETSSQSAELIKHASNAFLAMKISFINAVANICEVVGADIEDVESGLGSDSRIGPYLLRAGVGYGGPCLPKDIAAFCSEIRDYGCTFDLLNEVRKINGEQFQRFVRKVRMALWTLKNKRLAVLGIAFKDRTDDVRESPAINIIKSLLEEGCRICAFDPIAMDSARRVIGDAICYASDPYEAAEGADALLIVTEWKEFADLDLPRLRQLLKYPIVLDGRNLYDPDEMARAGLNYYSIGRPIVETSRELSLKSKVEE